MKRDYIFFSPLIPFKDGLLYLGYSGEHFPSTRFLKTQVKIIFLTGVKKLLKYWRQCVFAIYDIFMSSVRKLDPFPSFEHILI